MDILFQLANEKNKENSLFVCGCCGKHDDGAEKVVLSGYANILCFSCRRMLEKDIENIAKTYLKPNQISPFSTIK
jgi:hypothetical protein